MHVFTLIVKIKLGMYVPGLAVFLFVLLILVCSNV